MTHIYTARITNTINSNYWTASQKELQSTAQTSLKCIMLAKQGSKEQMERPHPDSRPASRSVWTLNSTSHLTAFQAFHHPVVNLYTGEHNITWGEITQATPTSSSVPSILASQPSFLFLVTLLLYRLELEILTFLSSGVAKPFCLPFGVKLSVSPPLFFVGVPSSLSEQRCLKW